MANPPTGLAATSLLPVIQNGTPVQKSILFTYDDTKAGSNSAISSVKAANRIRCIRTERWKFDYYFDDLNAYHLQYELYDLLKDPFETTNLAYNPAFKKTREDLEKQLHELELAKLKIVTPIQNKSGKAASSKSKGKLAALVKR